MVQRFASKGWWSTNSREVFQGKTREAGQQLFRPPPILLKRVNRLIGSCLFAISYVLFCVKLGLTFLSPQNLFSTQCANSFILHRVQFCAWMFRKGALWRRGRKMPTNLKHQPLCEHRAMGILEQQGGKIWQHKTWWPQTPDPRQPQPWYILYCNNFQYKWKFKCKQTGTTSAQALPILQ